MKRSTPLTVDPAKILAWRSRSQQAALNRQQQRRTSDVRDVDRVTRRRPRRNDGPWRREVLEVRGPQCRVSWCGRMTDIQVHHIIHRSMCGPSVLENGMPACRDHHAAIHAAELLIDPAWLDHDQIEWLADKGHAEWLLDGVVVGRHRRLFTDGPDRRETR